MDDDCQQAVNFKLLLVAVSIRNIPSALEGMDLKIIFLRILRDKAVAMQTQPDSFRLSAVQAPEIQLMFDALETHMNDPMAALSDPSEGPTH